MHSSGGKVHFKSIKRTLTVTKKEFIHIRRDRPSMAISFIMPIMMLLIFGFAVNTDVTDVKLVVYDGSGSDLSREMIDSYSNSDYFLVSDHVNSAAEVEAYIESGKSDVGLIIPEDFNRKIKRGEEADIQILIDGSDPTIARTAGSYSISIARNFSAGLSEEALKKSGKTSSGAGSVAAFPEFLYNPTLESSKFNIPGVIGLILQNITIILTALAMVREKELGTMEQLVMTPVKSVELIIGKLIPYVFIGCYDFLIVMVLSYLIFGLRVAGNVSELILLSFIFLIGALAMGMLISTVAKNQAQAIQGALAFLLPSVLLSGFMFPRSSMPVVIQWISNLFPITHFLIILRGIIVKGVGIEQVLQATIYMLLLISLLIGAAAVKFRKRLD